MDQRLAFYTDVLGFKIIDVMEITMHNRSTGTS
ncbi:MAG: VOC family protein [Saprospiraceae bacterium]|uniref:VOC family protein n=1 Tax=Candidatus Opimibacter skivensis TaxID=2982028 RepID=A0A9D7SZU0_9BACT|nr:VOC family protein [Candidatus Opimibacter skivensis]